MNTPKPEPTVGQKWRDREILVVVHRVGEIVATDSRYAKIVWNTGRTTTVDLKRLVREYDLEQPLEAS